MRPMPAPTTATLESISSPAESLWAGRRRYIALLLFTNLFINYIDRINLSIAAPAIASHFSWDAATMGLLFSSYQWTYCVFLLVWGALCDRFGTRAVNAASVSIWSLAAMLTGAASGLWSMLASRLVLGVGEAASFPAAGKVVRQWFPASERGLATAIFNAGTFAGPALAAPAIAWLLGLVGWRASFVICGAMGFIWVAVWLAVFRTPDRCAWLPPAERDYILTSSDAPIAAVAAPRRAALTLLSHRTMWGLFLTQGCCAYTMLLYLFWLPTYLVQARHMELSTASWFTAIPYLVASVLGLMVGRLSDRLLLGRDVRHGKRRGLLVLFILMSTSVLLTNRVEHELALLALVSFSLTSISSALSLNIALTSDLVWDPRMVGTALAISIMGGNLFGAAMPIVTGRLVASTGSFDASFLVAAALLLVAAAASLTMTRRPLSSGDMAVTLSA